MRILCIEDEHRIANTIKKGLEQEGYAVDVAYDGLTGYDMASTENYDIILLDRMLPKMDGMIICSELRKNHIQTPILMLTAKTQTHDKVEGLNLGADDYLTKPFRFDELVARIHALLRRPKTTITPQIIVGRLRIDTVNKTVFFGTKLISLSKREYALLSYLAYHPGQIFSKQQLIDHVWNFDSSILPNTVEVFIRSLRQKIDQPKQPSFIETVRGFGYRLKVDA
jgi:DNA-binding response OmpR family regulator